MLRLPASASEVRRFLGSFYCAELDELRALFLTGRRDARAHLLLQSEGLSHEELKQARRILMNWDGLGLNSTAEAYWDFRLGAERTSIPSSVDLLPPEIGAATSRLADVWGLSVVHTVNASVDVAFVLGGLLPSSLARVAFLSELVQSGQLTPGVIVGLAGHRYLTRLEAQAADAHGICAQTEAGALRQALEVAFCGYPFHLDVAPDYGGRRASTSSAFAWWLSNRTDVMSAAVITTSIYRIQSHVAFQSQTNGDIPVLTASVKNTGFASEPRTQHYLQEIKASLDAVSGLARWANDHR